MKKELDIAVAPKPTVPDASSKIGQMINTINGPPPNQVNTEKVEAEQAEQECVAHTATHLAAKQVRDTIAASLSAAGSDEAVTAAAGDAAAGAVSGVTQRNMVMVVQSPTPNPYTVTPSRPLNTNLVLVEPSQSGQTTAALLLAQEGPRAMERDSSREEDMVVSGGKVLLYHKLLVAIRRNMIDSLQSFKTHVWVIETGKRIVKG